MIEQYPGMALRIHPDCFVHPSAVVAGALTVEAGSSIWYNAVIRADIASVHIGPRCNVQDGVVIHVGRDMLTSDQQGNVTLEENVTVGHGAIVHGCKVGKNVLIGMGATILSGAQIGDNCIIAARALVLEGQVIPPGSMVMGLPGKVKRPLTAEEIASLPRIAKGYCREAAHFAALGMGEDLSGLWP